MKKYLGTLGEIGRVPILGTLGFGSRGSSVQIRPRRPFKSLSKSVNCGSFEEPYSSPLNSDLVHSCARGANRVFGNHLGKIKSSAVADLKGTPRLTGGQTPCASWRLSCSHYRPFKSKIKHKFARAAAVISDWSRILLVPPTVRLLAHLTAGVN